MSLLLDVSGFLDVLLTGLANALQALAIGGILFRWMVIRSVDRAASARLDAPMARGIAWSAGGLAVVELIVLTFKAAILLDTVGLSTGQAASAGFVLAGLTRCVLALLIVAGSLARPPRAHVLLAVLALSLVAAGTFTNHAIARLDDRLPLMVATAVHQLAAAAWIGGLAFFIYALAMLPEGWLAMARRFSTICVVSVGALLVAGLFKSWLYIGEPAAVWGTAYGIMTGTKVLLFATLLGLGAFNFLALRRAADAPVAAAVRRRAEVELAIGLVVFFAAASLTSLPPAVDLPNDRATLAEVIERLTPAAPRLSSPSHATLSLPAVQARLDAEARAAGQATPPAFVPGAGEAKPRNTEDAEWSEYNHNWAGVFVLAIGILSVIERSTGARWARAWPLVFLGLAVFLFVRSDPSGWPLGDIGFFENFRDPEVLQHRVYVVLIVAFGLFEWAVRTGRLTNRRAAFVFPVVSIVASGLLLAHTHALANVREELLTEITHVPIALLGLATGTARWIELRAPADQRRIASLIWPFCFVAVGLLLLTYREV